MVAMLKNDMRFVVQRGDEEKSERLWVLGKALGKDVGGGRRVVVVF